MSQNRRWLFSETERWAQARIASGRAAHLPLDDVPSTEWPRFGSVFYLAATANLQQVLLVRATFLNVHDVLNADHIVIAPKALPQIEAWLVRKEEK